MYVCFDFSLNELSIGLLFGFYICKLLKMGLLLNMFYGIYIFIFIIGI